MFASATQFGLTQALGLMDIIPLLLGFFGFIILLMTPFEAQTLRQTAKRGGGHLRLSLALLLAFGINTAGITTFVVVFIGLGFGVPNIAGDGIVLPWITAFPSLLLGAWLGTTASARLTATAIEWVLRRGSSGQAGAA